jgi:predicted PurR-regulated permease PerM
VSGSTGTARAPLPRGLLILLGLAAATVALAGMKSIAHIIDPTFLALVLMITVHPIRGWLVRKHVPGWVAALATILTVYAILIALIVAMIVSLARLAQLAPSYAPDINNLTQDATDWLKSLGVDQKQLDDVLGSLDVGKLFDLATTILSSTLGVLSNLVFIGLVALFIGMDGGRFTGILHATTGERPAIVVALSSFAHNTRKYFAVSAIFGLIVAVIDSAALYLLGIPAALVWGLLAFVTNFVPNIGFIIGVIPPAILGLLEGGPALMIAVIVVYCVINFIIQSVIQPKVVGDVLGLSTTLTFLALVFWTWVLGPLGAILALPMTLLAKALLIDVDPEYRWLGPLLSGHPDESPTEAAAPDPVDPGSPGDGSVETGPVEAASTDRVTPPPVEPPRVDEPAGEPVATQGEPS